MAELGARLIHADRRHAAEWEACILGLHLKPRTPPDHFEEHCRKEAETARRKGVSEALLQARQQRQSEALEAYLVHKDSHLFTLLLPTGYGKTLAGLRVALEAVRSGRCRRILYVAPYISILSQAAGVLEKATGKRVVLHHQMPILEALRMAGQSSLGPEPSGLRRRLAPRRPPALRPPRHLAGPDRRHHLQPAFSRPLPRPGSGVPAHSRSGRGLRVHRRAPDYRRGRLVGIPAGFGCRRPPASGRRSCSARLPCLLSTMASVTTAPATLPLVKAVPPGPVSRFVIRSTWEPWNADRVACGSPAAVSSR